MKKQLDEQYVIADYEKRKQMIVEQIKQIRTRARLAYSN